MKNSLNIAVIFTIALAGCDSAEKRLAAADSDGTISSYRDVISRYPDSEQAQTANRRIADIESWSDIQDQRDLAAYATYIDEYPDGLFVAEAESRVSEIDAFSAAATIDTVPAYQQFSLEYPDNIFSGDVGRRIAELAQADVDFGLIDGGEDIEGFRAYLVEYEDTGYANLALTQLEGLIEEPFALLGAMFDCYWRSNRGDVLTTTRSADGNEAISGTIAGISCNDQEIDVLSTTIEDSIIKTVSYGDFEIRTGQGPGSFTLWASRDYWKQLLDDTVTFPLIEGAAVASTPDGARIVTAQLEDGRTFEMPFQYVDGGCYEMGDILGAGSANEKPVHTVCVDGFYIGRFEVTRGQWNDIVGSVPSTSRCSTERCPVGGVTWYDAQLYADILTDLVGTKFRLPTEAEWEYACRSGGNPETYSGGEDVDALGWHSGNSNRIAHEVGMKSPNSLQLFDMSGNVSEFVEDAYSETAYADHTRANPLFRAVRESHTLRGGNYYFNGGAPTVRCAIRHSSELHANFANYGFRLVMVE